MKTKLIELEEKCKQYRIIQDEYKFALDIAINKF